MLCRIRKASDCSVSVRPASIRTSTDRTATVALAKLRRPRGVSHRRPSHPRCARRRRSHHRLRTDRRLLRSDIYLRRPRRLPRHAPRPCLRRRARPRRPRGRPPCTTDPPRVAPPPRRIGPSGSTPSVWITSRPPWREASPRPTMAPTPVFGGRARAMRWSSTRRASGWAEACRSGSSRRGPRSPATSPTSPCP